ncbi:MAG: 30S ribosome-binding factor RbfA [Planctomycetota bacterium]
MPTGSRRDDREDADDRKPRAGGASSGGDPRRQTRANLSGGNPSRGARGRVSLGRGPLGPLDDAASGGDRIAQVAAEIRRGLQSELGRGLNDPRVQGLVSVTEVMVLPDFSEARVKVSVMPADRSALTLSGLRAAAGFLRRRLMDETRIGRVPRLAFDLDESLKRQAALDAAIRGSEAPGALPGAGPGREENERP